MRYNIHYPMTGKGISIRATSRVFRFRMPSTSLWAAGIWSAGLCMPRWIRALKIGVEVRFGDGCNVQSLNRSCYPHGRYHVSQIGLIESMNLLLTVNLKQSATAPRAEYHLGMKVGSNPSHDDWTSNQQYDLASDQECNRYHPSINTKRLAPFAS